MGYCLRLLVLHSLYSITFISGKLNILKFCNVLLPTSGTDIVMFLSLGNKVIFYLGIYFLFFSIKFEQLPNFYCTLVSRGIIFRCLFYRLHGALELLVRR